MPSPDLQLVEALRRLTGQAERGELVSLCYVAQEANGRTEGRGIGVAVDLRVILGEISLVRREVEDALLTQPTSKEDRALDAHESKMRAAGWIIDEDDRWRSPPSEGPYLFLTTDQHRSVFEAGLETYEVHGAYFWVLPGGFGVNMQAFAEWATANVGAEWRGASQPDETPSSPQPSETSPSPQPAPLSP